MKWFSLSIMLIGFAALTGCSETDQSARREQVDSTLPYYSPRELEAELAERASPVVVEFCVPYGCARCETMRSQVNRLAQDKSNGIEILRVDFNQNRAFAAQMGVTVCPSYIAFDGGQELFRIAYPTSGDLIASAFQSVRPGAPSSTPQLSDQSVH